MSNTTVNYRLRIRNLADSADALVLTSVPGGTNPWVIDPPTGDGQELDPITGEVRTGQYTITCADPVIAGSSPPSRIITSQLFDANGRQQLLSRRSYVEVSYNLGSTWSGVIVGYLTEYRLTDAITWEFSIGDTRRIENTRIVFDGTSTTFAQRGCLFGGPMAGGAWGPINDRGGWKMKVLQIFPATAGMASAYVTYGFVNGYQGINDPLTTRYSDMIGSSSGGLVGLANEAAQSFYMDAVPQQPPSSGYYGSIASGYGQPGFPGVIALIQEFVTAANNGRFIPWAALQGDGVGPNCVLSPYTYLAGQFGVLWPDGMSLPTVGNIHTIQCFTAAPTDDSPVYFDLHPVDVVTGLYTDAGIPYDASAAAALRLLLGATLRVAMRITESSSMLDWLQANIFGPFGFSSRTSISGASIGEAQLFATRLKLSSGPSTTIGTADLQDASGVVFDNDEQTVVAIVRFKSKIFWAYNPNTQTDTSTRPLDSVMESDTEVSVTNVDPGVAFATTECDYEIPGLIHDVSGAVQDMNAYTSAIALEIFDRFGRGAPVCDALAVLVGSDTGFNIGDEIYVEPAHFPNLNYRLADNPSVGARIMQVLRRTESPAGPLVKVIDAGSDQQPATPAALITIAANTAQPRTVAQFTITNAAAINTAASLVVAVQWASGSSSPGSNGGLIFARYPAGICPTGAVNLPSVAPGTTLWVSARTETPGLRPSAWTSWASVTLSAVPSPSALTFSPVYENAAQFNWTPANSTDAVDVFVFQGSSAPPDWTPYFVGTLQPGSTSCVVRNITGPSVAYLGAVAHRDIPSGKDGPLVTGTFTTTSTTITTAPVPTGFEILPITQDASLLTGIVLALYAFDPVYDLVIQRAPDSSGSPGTFATIAQVGGATPIFVDYLPNDGVKRWYQVAHALSGDLTSAYVPYLSAVPGGVSRMPVRPPLFTNPQLSVKVVVSATSGSQTTIQVTVIDPLGTLASASVSWSQLNWSSVIDASTSSALANPFTVTPGTPKTIILFPATVGAGNCSISFDASGTSRYDGFATFGAGPAPVIASPSMTIAIGTSISPSNPSAPTSAVVTAPSNTASIKWLASSTAQPTISATESGGTSIAVGGSPQFAIASLGIDLYVAPATPNTVYLTVVYYDSTGTPQSAAMGQATRDSLAATKTATYSAAGLIPVGKISGVTSDAAQLDSSTTPGVVALTNSPVSAGVYRAFMNILLPPGCTLATVAQDVYWGSQGTLLTFTQNFYRNPPGGSAPTLLINASVTAGLGWQTWGPTTLTGETVQGNGYMYLVQWVGRVAMSINPAEGLVGNIYLQYTSPGDTASF